MRKFTFLLAFSLSAAFAESAKLVVESQHAAGGERVVQVQNDSELPATAFLVATSETAFGSTDILLGAREGRPLKPGERAEVRVPSSGDAEAQVLAAIFEDGTTGGDSRWVNHLFTARRRIYAQIPLALALLRNANVQNFPASTVAAWFRQWQDRWLAGDPAAVAPVPLAAEIYLKRAGNAPAAEPAHELIQVFEELSAKLAASRPEL